MGQNIDTLPGYKNSSVEKLLLDYIDLCFFHFKDRKELRYLWLLEGYIARLTERAILLNINIRDMIIKNVILERFVWDEDFTFY